MGCELEYLFLKESSIFRRYNFSGRYYGPKVYVAKFIYVKIHKYISNLNNNLYKMVKLSSLIAFKGRILGFWGIGGIIGFR